MRRSPFLTTAAAAALLTACTPTTEQPATETSTPTPSSTEAVSPSASGAASAGAVQVSPGGVTTAVDAPANATESGYGQACLAARAWLDGRPGEPAELAEAYLETLQSPGAVGPGSFNMAWSDLTPGQQSGVIMAVNSAANKECG